MYFNNMLLGAYNDPVIYSQSAGYPCNGSAKKQLLSKQIIETEIMIHKQSFPVLAVCLFLIIICLGCTRLENYGQKEIAPIVELTLATMDYSNFTRVALHFNESNNEGIVVKVVDYSQNTTREAAINRLNMEIASGKGPDLIDFEAFPCREIYARKGLLLDLSSFFTQDCDTNDYYLLNRINPSGLFFLPSGFDLMTCYGPEEIFHDRMEWSLEECYELLSSQQFADSKPSDRWTFMQYSCIRAIPACLDWDTLECSFDRPEFSSMLQFAAGLDDGLDNSNQLGMPFSGQQLYTETWILHPSDIASAESSVAYPISFIGYPTIDGSCGTYYYLATLAAVNKNTQFAEESWHFLRYMISDVDFQRYVCKYDLPIKKSVLEELVSSLEEPTEVTDREEISYLGEANPNSEPVLSKRQSTILYNLLEKADTLYDYDPTIFSIIRNESEKYFTGSSTLATTVNEIQTKVALYLWESIA